MAEISDPVGSQLGLAAPHETVGPRRQREEKARGGDGPRRSSDGLAERVAELAVAPPAGAAVVGLQDQLGGGFGIGAGE